VYNAHCQFLFKKLSDSQLSVFIIRYHSFAICAFEIKEWFILSSGDDRVDSRDQPINKVSTAFFLEVLQNNMLN
jgi:hypothetical protein